MSSLCEERHDGRAAAAARASAATVFPHALRTFSRAQACTARRRASRRGSSVCSLPVSSSAQSAGVTVSATTIEASTATMNVSASGPMKRPCTPPSKQHRHEHEMTASVA